MKIIGQKKLINKKFKPFTIITGENGSGKSTLIREKYSMDKLYIAEKNVDGVREVIKDSNQLSSERVYVFLDCDDMNRQSQNALLKIAEEPNKFTSIILTIVDEKLLLPTIISRAEVVNMELYTKEQLLNFTDNEEFISYYNQPGQLKNTNTEIVDLTKKIVQALDKITLANAFNIEKNINELTEDLSLVLKPLKYFMRYDYEIVKLISRYEYYLTQSKFNFTFDEFVIKLYKKFRNSEYKDRIISEVG
ncbi:MAG: hypothetical protein ACOC1K_06080 [Nanoarchaeota archaeon]